MYNRYFNQFCIPSDLTLYWFRTAVSVRRLFTSQFLVVLHLVNFIEFYGFHADFKRLGSNVQLVDDLLGIR